MYLFEPTETVVVVFLAFALTVLVLEFILRMRTGEFPFIYSCSINLQTISRCRSRDTKLTGWFYSNGISGPSPILDFFVESV